MKRVAIVQSNYIPWKGYFDLIRSVDEFVLYDDAQYTARDWRNRNRIKTKDGLRWLTIPVPSDSRTRAIKDVVVSEKGWGKKHWAALAHAYAKAAHFRAFAARFEALYLGALPEKLSEVNRVFIDAVCGALSIRTKITASMAYRVDPRLERTRRLVDLCRQAGATTYVSGPKAKAYMDEGAFREAGVELRYFRYPDYPVYRQLHPPFCHEVSALDLLFNAGPAAAEFLGPVHE